MSDEPKIDIARPIVDKFGGINAMSKDTGIPYGRIQGWLQSGTIPDKWRADVLAHAHRLGIPHTPWDYIAHLVGLKIAA